MWHGCDAVKSGSMGRGGLELPPETPTDSHHLRTGGAESGATRRDAASESAPAVSADPDLARVVEAWPSLPEPIRRAVISLVNSTSGT